AKRCPCHWADPMAGKSGLPAPHRVRPAAGGPSLPIRPRVFQVPAQALAVPMLELRRPGAFRSRRRPGTTDVARTADQACGTLPVGLGVPPGRPVSDAQACAQKAGADVFSFFYRLPDRQNRQNHYLRKSFANVTRQRFGVTLALMKPRSLVD